MSNEDNHPPVPRSRRADAIAGEVLPQPRLGPEHMGHLATRESSRLLGVVTPFLHHPFYTSLLQLMRDAARPTGYSLRIVDSAGQSHEELNAIQELDRTRVEGIILLSPASPEVTLEPALHPQRPIIVINSWLWESHNPPAGAVVLNWDIEHGARAAMQYLFEEQHTRIAFIDSAVSARSNHTPRNVYELMMVERSLEYQYVVEAHDPLHDYESGYRAGRRLMGAPKGEQPTAILACNDGVALGAMRAVVDCEYSVPDYVSVIGFEDWDVSDFSIPRLTTVGMSRANLATTAIRLLIGIAQRDRAAGPPPLIPTRLVIRDSSGQAHSS
jgi:DNA-binding LacI/PurR family transcriptional regulator